jgi:hypothetical protein
VTLLLLPLAVHTAVGFRATANVVLIRWQMENEWRKLEDQLRPWVAPAGGKILSSDYNSMVRLRGRLDIEPLIYTLLVSAKVVDPEPVRRDIERREFSIVILGQNVFKPMPVLDLEIGTLPAAQLDAIRSNYRLVAHYDGPFLDGAYVYQPVDGAR